MLTRIVAASTPLRILMLALALRLLWIALIPVEPVSDAKAYDLLARNIATYGVYGFEPTVPSAYWAVGTAAIYAAGYSLLGLSYGVVEALNLAASMASVWCLYLLGRLYYGETCGRVAALCYAVWPLTIQFGTTLSSELFFICATLIFLICWEKARRPGGSLAWIVAAGLCLAAATYIRPVAQLLPFVLMLSDILRRDRRILRTVAHGAVTLALLAALIAPWSHRNTQVFGEYVMISTNFGPNFWMGNNPDTQGTYMPLPERVKDLGEIERAAVLEAEAKAYVRADPAAFVTRTLIKALRLHERETIGVAWNAAAIERYTGTLGPPVAKAISTLYWYLMLGGALTGVVVLFRSGNTGFPMTGLETLISPPLLLWGYFTAVHAVTVIGDRYHMPSIPCIALLCGAAVSFWLMSDRSRPEPELAR